MATRVKTTGMDKATARVLGAMKRLKSSEVERVLRGTGDEVIQQWRVNINQGKSAEGKFAPLSPRYAAWKAEHFPGRPILKATTSMWKGFYRLVTKTGPARYTLEVSVKGNDPRTGTPNIVKALAHINGVDPRTRYVTKRRKRAGEGMGYAKVRERTTAWRLPRRNFTALKEGFILRSLSEWIRSQLTRKQ